MPNLGLGLWNGRPRPLGGGFSAQAQNYFDRLDTAGDTTYVAYKQPIANYIDGLVANSLWDKLESAALFVGVGLEGIVVPLKSTMPTLANNNFVGEDLSQTTGLKAVTGNEYLQTGLNADDLSQNDAFLNVYITEDDTTNLATYCGSSRFRIASSVSNVAPFFYCQSTSSDQINVGPTTVGNFVGMSRDNSADFDYSINGATGTKARVSTAPITEEICVFASTAGANQSQSRQATYAVGASLNMATLKTLQDTLITEIAAI